MRAARQRADRWRRRQRPVQASRVTCASWIDHLQGCRLCCSRRNLAITLVADDCCAACDAPDLPMQNPRVSCAAPAAGRLHCKCVRARRQNAFAGAHAQRRTSELALGLQSACEPVARSSAKSARQGEESCACRVQLVRVCVRACVSERAPLVVLLVRNRRRLE